MGHIEKYAAQGVSGRYVRLTATRLMNVAGGGFSGVSGGYYLALGKMDVYSGGKEIAALCPVTADPTYGNDNDVAQVTRPARLGGETTFMDHPENVTDREHLEAAGPQGPRAAHGRDAGGRRFPDGHGR